MPVLTGKDTPAELQASLSMIEEWVGGGGRYSRRGELLAEDWKAELTGLVKEAIEFMVLRGPEPADLASLRGHGYDPDALAQGMTDVTAREQRMKDALLAKSPGQRRPHAIATCAPLVHDEGLRVQWQACVALGLPGAWTSGWDADRLTDAVDRTPI